MNLKLCIAKFIAGRLKQRPARRGGEPVSTREEIGRLDHEVPVIFFPF
jgi:hypothetical protein